MIATGTSATKDAHIPFDGQHIFISDDILAAKEHLPRTLAVVGAGVIGLEYACMFAALGVRVTLIDKRNACSRLWMPRSSMRWPTTCAKTA